METFGTGSNPRRSRRDVFLGKRPFFQSASVRCIHGYRRRSVTLEVGVSPMDKKQYSNTMPRTSLTNILAVVSKSLVIRILLNYAGVTKIMLSSLAQGISCENVSLDHAIFASSVQGLSNVRIKSDNTVVIW